MQNAFLCILQVDENAFEETKKATELFPAIEKTFGIKWQSVQWKDLLKPLYSGLAARILLHQKSKSVPRSIEEQAELWANEFLPASSDHSALVETFSDLVQNLPSRKRIFVDDGSKGTILCFTIQSLP